MCEGTAVRRCGRAGRGLGGDAHADEVTCLDVAWGSGGALVSGGGAQYYNRGYHVGRGATAPRAPDARVWLVDGSGTTGETWNSA